jgi:undecaprenyl-diphosphatase
MEGSMPFYAKVVILALIQGAAELLPVSSSAHVILAQKLMDLDPSKPDMVFLLIMLHTGTMFAAIVYFWSGWKAILFAPTKADNDGLDLAGAALQPGGAAPEGAKDVNHVPPSPMSGRRFLGMIVLATAATGVLGLGLQFLIERVVLEKMMGRAHGEVEELFKSLPLIGAALTAAGLLILASSRYQWTGGVLSVRTALFIGLVQGLCLPFRGFSRSGATISTALACGVPRRFAEEFSFALAVVLTPPIIVRQTWKLLDSREAAGAHLLDLLLPGLVGMVLAFLSGLAALRLLSAVLEGGHWAYFGVYCLVFAGVMFVAAWCGL